MHTPSPIQAVLTVLDRLALDLETIRKGTDALHLSLSPELDDQRKLLSAQSAALERMSISLAMAMHALESAAVKNAD